MTTDNPDSRHGTPVILIVEDDIATRLLIRRALQADGYAFLEAADGAQALAAWQSGCPDLVLMDAVMPVMDGFTACARIQELAGGAAPPVLIITMLDDENSIERAFAAGARDFIPKPVHWAVLRQRVHHILQARRAEQRILHLAYHDTLTDLPNRKLFIDRFQSALAGERRSGRLLAVLFIDLDRFKTINDTLGHEAGDQILREVAARLKACVRASDSVARFGGDEFTILLKGITEPRDVALIAEKILTALNHPIKLAGHAVLPKASIGIALRPYDGRDADTLIRNADTAMYRAKSQGCNTYQFYTTEMGATTRRRLALENGLYVALERQELVLLYEPCIDLDSGAVGSLEALLRWQHPQWGLVQPTEFIPLAEAMGLIGPIEQWVLDSACTRLKEWQSQGFPKLGITVSLAARQFWQADLVATVETVLAQTALEPTGLTLKLTESMLMQDPATALEKLRRLRALRIRLTLDHFGTGCLPFSYLRRFPLDSLRIGPSFMAGIPADPDSTAVVRAMIALARSLDLQVVAEGVDTLEQLHFLHLHRCGAVQGYLFSKPQPAEQLPDFLHGYPRESAHRHSFGEPHSGH